MICKQLFFKNSEWQGSDKVEVNQSENILIFHFGDRIDIEKNQKSILELQQLFPKSSIVTITTSGGITNNAQVVDEIVANVIEFSKIKFVAKHFLIDSTISPFDLGENVFKTIQAPDLKHILVFTPGHDFNGSEFVLGLNHKKPDVVSVSGGLAGDDDRFEKTLIGYNGDLSEKMIVAIGLYGDNVQVCTDSQGGWQPFGVTRRITKSDRNVIYEIDGQGALDIYKNYLGEYANELPGMALFFPLEMKRNEGDEPLVRSILSIDDVQNSMTFAGDMPEGSTIRLMRGITDELILAAGNTIKKESKCKTDLTFLISCVGRRITLGPRTEEELEEIREKMKPEDFMFGYYSYGEISQNEVKNCELYNQSMTITTISENG